MLKQKRLYEGQRDQLYSQQFNLEQTTFVMESAKDTVNTVQALKATSKDMKQAFKSKELDISSIEKLQDELADFAVGACAAGASRQERRAALLTLARLQDINNEIQDVMGQNFALPYDIDEDELMGELDGMEDELAGEFETGAGAPSYLQVRRPQLAAPAPTRAVLAVRVSQARAWGGAQDDLPSAPTAKPHTAEAEDDFGLPAVPQRT